MGSRIQCFWLEPTDRVRIKLRRYTYGGESERCSGGPMSGHDASRPLGVFPVRYSDEHGRPYLASRDELAPPRDDERWSTHCDQCGTALGETQWQVFQDHIYRRVDTGEETTLRDAPPGAMYDAEWYPEKGPDGIALCVAMPPDGGLDYWFVDGPATNGPGWQRSGTVPRVTANPSIQTRKYHGYLRDGWLEEC